MNPELIKIDFNTYFTENKLIKDRLEKEWEINKKYFKECFEEVLVAVETHYKKYDKKIFKSKFIGRRYKDMIGAHGIGKTKINIGLISEDTIRNKNITLDHVIGYKTCSKKVINDFKKYNFDISYMKDDWLKNHLHLWLVIKVTKEEHKTENIIRGDEISDYEQNFLKDYQMKLKLNHYKNVSQLYLNCNFKFNYFSK